jgi:PAS domain S-box-containing protein
MNQFAPKIKTSFRFTKTYPFLALVIILLLSVYGWRDSINSLKNRNQEKFQTRVTEKTQDIIGKMNDYELILRGAAGLFIVSDAITGTQWHDYVKNLNLAEHFPGIQGVGFAKYIESSELPEHIKSVRAQGFPDYTVWPEGERSEYTSIVYLEPLDPRNQKAIGYDMFSEATRRAAMEKARDTGRTCISGKVKLVQEIDKDVQAGFLMYVPVYKRGAPITNADGRRAALLGYAYSPFRVGDLMKGIFGNTVQDIYLRIYDGDTTTENSLMYDSIFGLSALSRKNEGLFTEKRVISLYGRKWTLIFSYLPPVEDYYEKYRSSSILALGLIIGLLVFIFLRSEDRTREREEKYRNIFNSSEVGMFRSRLDGSELLEVNDKFLKILNRTREEVIGKPSVILWVDPHEREEMVRRIKADGQITDFEYRLLTAQGEERTCLTSLKSYPDQGIVEGSILDITDRKRMEQEKANLIIKLQQSLSEIKQLSRILPICASCKKIRDDEGYWKEVETYISDHSEAQFSHGICPDCMRKLYPEIADEVLGRLGKDEKK